MCTPVPREQPRGGLKAEEHNEEQDQAPGEPGLQFSAEEAGCRFRVEQFLQP